MMKYRRALLAIGGVLFLLISAFHSLAPSPLNQEQSYLSTDKEINDRKSGADSSDNRLHRRRIPFTMCDRPTPPKFTYNPTIPNNSDQPIFEPITSWPTDNKLLVLNTDPTFGKIGNHFNSLLHAYDYARDNRMKIGTTLHSWAMTTIQSMFMENNARNSNLCANSLLIQKVLTELRIKVMCGQNGERTYDEVVHLNSKDAYFYQSPNSQWKESMNFHVSILHNLLRFYNHDVGYDHNGLRTQDVCSGLEYIFRDFKNDVKYSIIHYEHQDEKAQFKLKQISKTSGCSDSGALEMGPSYVRSILKPLGMLDVPIILISVGQYSEVVEEKLLEDPVIGSQVIVLSNKLALDGKDVALALLADVFIGNPVSVTSGFIARTRSALGYGSFTSMFRKYGMGLWYNVCDDECVFNPNFLMQLV